MKQLIIKALNIWLPMSVFLAPIAFWEIIFKDIFNFRDDPMRSIFEFFGSCTIISAYILFPLFFIYQIVLKLKKKVKQCQFYYVVNYVFNNDFEYCILYHSF